jgi:hypothetical protein
MISNRLAGNIIIGGLVLSLSWLGYCAARDFVQTSSSYRSK